MQMSLREVIARTTDGPITQSRIVAELLSLGIRPGDTLMVHSSLSSIGYVVGGAMTVVTSLEEAVGPAGTIMMPAFSEGAPEPSRWRNPPVPESWWATIRRATPPWDPEMTPTSALGIIPETFRLQSGTHRSRHPNVSFCARGPHSRELLSAHHLDFGIGERSPVDRLYDLDGKILLLGVDHGSNSSLHLAEFRSRWKGREKELRFSGKLLRDGKVVHVRFRDLDGTSDDFAQLGNDYEGETGNVNVGLVGMAKARLMEVRPLIDYAVEWLPKHRGPMEPKPSSSEEAGGRPAAPRFQIREASTSAGSQEGKWQTTKRRNRASRVRR